MSIKTEDLLQILDNPIEVTNIDYNDILTFILEFSITSGKQMVSIDFLYDLYCHWSSVKESKPKFIQTLDGILPISQSKYCLVNKNIKDLERITVRLTKKKPKPLVRVRQVIIFDYMEDTNTYAGRTWAKVMDVFADFKNWMYNRNRRAKIGYNSFVDNVTSMFEFKLTKEGYYIRINRKVPSAKAQEKEVRKK